MSRMPQPSPKARSWGSCVTSTVSGTWRDSPQRGKRALTSAAAEGNVDGKYTEGVVLLAAQCCPRGMESGMAGSQPGTTAAHVPCHSSRRLRKLKNMKCREDAGERNRSGLFV